MAGKPTTQSASSQVGQHLCELTTDFESSFHYFIFISKEKNKNELVEVMIHTEPMCLHKVPDHTFWGLSIIGKEIATKANSPLIELTTDLDFLLRHFRATPLFY
jgi:hypothetical protein